MKELYRAGPETTTTHMPGWTKCLEGIKRKRVAFSFKERKYHRLAHRMGWRRTGLALLTGNG
jgi:hypothetical protein